MAVSPQVAEELARRHGSAVYAFCRRLAPSRHDADDVYQQVFLRIMDMPGTVDVAGNPCGFLMAVAARVWHDEVRKRARRERIAPTVDLDDPASVCEVAGSDRVDADLDAAQERRSVRRAVRALPEKLRVPVLLFYMGGLSVEAVARALRIPQGTVKSRLSQARGRIERTLREDGYGA